MIAIAEPMVGDLRLHESHLPIVHAAKRPCWWNAVGGKQASPGAWNYLFVIGERHLYLNMVDADARFFRPELFSVACDFIDRHQGAVAIHCNEGLSRAPSIALVWLAKRAGILPAASFAEAKLAYLARNPDYAPGVGIEKFLTDHWADLR